MDNVSTQNTRTIHNQSNPAPRSILTLDLQQYRAYQTNYIEIRTPEGKHLHSFGLLFIDDETESNAYRLREQISLMENVLSHTRDGVELSQHAVAGLADLLQRIRGFFDRYIK